MDLSKNLRGTSGLHRYDLLVGTPKIQNVFPASLIILGEKALNQLPGDVNLFDIPIFPGTSFWFGDRNAQLRHDASQIRNAQVQGRRAWKPSSYQLRHWAGERGKTLVYMELTKLYDVEMPFGTCPQNT